MQSSATGSTLYSSRTCPKSVLAVCTQAVGVLHHGLSADQDRVVLGLALGEGGAEHLDGLAVGGGALAPDQEPPLGRLVHGAAGQRPGQPVAVGAQLGLGRL